MIQWKYKNSAKVLTTREKGGVPYLSFDVLEKTGLVINGFSTRLGGVSKGDCASMNFSYTRGDDPKDVLENFTRMATALGRQRPDDRILADPYSQCPAYDQGR
ncbi:MAG: laccase domain-containing protein [Clostridium sp.]